MTDKKVVVVGNGMVGSRFVEDLVARDPDERFQITVLGAEEYAPYNRVLLSEVVAGNVGVASLTLPSTNDSPRARIMRGTTAIALDRRGRRVITADGGVHPYDYVVLAAGSKARIPATRGLSPIGGLPAGVHALRTLDDAREIVAATVNARRAVVVGGGVLGLEAACGLAKRGLRVTLLHGSSNVMGRQLGPEAAAVVARAVAGLDIDLRTDVVTEQFVLRDGRVTAVRFAAEQIDTDLVVLACGTIPETVIASSAGLSVAEGVVVNRNLASPDDPCVFAIGDCAQPSEGSSGLIAQGWEQSRRLAAQLTRSRAPESPTLIRDTPRRPSMALRIAMEHLSSAQLDARGTDVVRLKAAGLDVVTMGARPDAANSAQRVVRLSDPAAGRFLEVVVEDGRLTGAVCVGSGQVGADLVVTYTRGTPVPTDPAYLLLRSLGGTPATANDPTAMPEDTAVCRCNGVTKRDIVTGWRDGAATLDQIASVTRATTGCGGCKEAVAGLIDWMAKSDPDRSSSPIGGAGGENSVTAPKHAVTTAKPLMHSAETRRG
ncbi:assimilatory nitrate reductase (NADH) beta subunit [Antricoccus suffuscus]|uniref:Assimilatory nitrate reductase (NADH) beta subunit n=1 Tax=Antricoccus suffuscus TaxID=1629062 RepID=A0A2T1A6P6_9ACTN|nr:FAD-dependent oxidoreductase [Antricoccus suffuscus]PRZ44285.1 assimilatory nitrate reductase (NADH) beta subunit [Antricoccus suffuscus]